MSNIDFDIVITPESKQREQHASFLVGVSVWLDSTVKSRGYDNIVSCASYANSTDAQFRAEAAAAVAWRDAVYRKLYELQANAPEGVTTLEQVIDLLPQPQAFGWPA
ncbi:hypothetical protein ABWU93_11290 [Xanthomonas translucens pv. translucens]|uniref:hypothetical protein n=1 Tax=Xanthomonas campestris pv. translucens TaxID=343 RepID=UPI003F6EA745